MIRRHSMTRKMVYLLHWALFFLFGGTAATAFVVWQTTGSLGTAGIIATGAAFFATASAFLERLFPGKE